MVDWSGMRTEGESDPIDRAAGPALFGVPSQAREEARYSNLGSPNQSPKTELKKPSISTLKAHNMQNTRAGELWRDSLIGFVT